MRVLLVDDEPLALRGLVRAISTMPGIALIGTAADGDDAIAKARQLAPDLVILDVEMPGPNGLAVATALHRIDGPEIVILSAFDRYAADAFAVEAIDYLLKPLRPDRLRQAIDRARRRRAEKAAMRSVVSPRAPDMAAACLHVPDRHGGHDVPLDEIVWIEAARDYALVHTATRSHLLRTTMADLTASLPATIPRVHRSAFVSLAHVERWAPPQKGVYRLVLSDRAVIPVGPTYVADVRAALRALDR